MGRYRIFVLGAGFSCAAGLPPGAELWRRVQSRASGRGGRAGRFDDDLATYLQYLWECDGLKVTPENVDFEDFLAFLDIEHRLGLAGSDTWSSDGNESQVLVKCLIGQILVELTPSAEKLPRLYYDFAEQLGPGDYVLTFNYDTVLERALEHVGRDYRLFPSRYTQICDGGGYVDLSPQEVVVLKLHGSVDWFDRADYSLLERSSSESGLPAPRNPVFGPGAPVRVEPLLEGPQFPDDSLRTVYRVVEGLETLYKNPPIFHATPWLLTPSSAKALYAHRFNHFWRGMGQAGSMNLGVIIVGYSLPPHDDYAKQALFRMLRNYQDTSWDEVWPGELKKSPVLLVDRQDEAHRAAYRSHFGFIDADKSKCHFSGFDEGALALIRSI